MIAHLTIDLTAIETYPFERQAIETVYPNFSFEFSGLTDDSLIERPRLVLVRDTVKPSIVFGESVSETTPTLEPDGHWHQAWQVSSITLSDARALLRDRARGVLDKRLERLTGMELVLFGELQSVEADAAPTAARYPLIDTIAVDRGLTLTQAVAFVANLRDAYKTRAADFVAKYVDVIDRIQSAGTIAEAKAIFDELDAIP